MRNRAADRIKRGVANEQVEISAGPSEGVIARGADLATGLPPAVLAADDPWIETRVQPGAGPDLTLYGLDDYPVARADTPRGGGHRVQLYLRIGDTPAQARQSTMLTLAELRRFGTGENQWVPLGQVGP